MAKDISKLANRTFDLLLTSSYTDAGYADDISVSRTFDTYDRKVQQLHNQVMGQVLIGVQITLNFTLREITLANLAKAYPWYTSPGEPQLMPTSLGVDLYDYADQVALHPRDAADNTQDIVLYKAVVTGEVQLEGNGEDDFGIPMELVAFPDRSELPDLVIGQIGRPSAT